MAVPKQDGTTSCVEITKLLLIRCLIDQYPLHKPEDLFAMLAGGKKFSTLDLSHAYNQVELDEDSWKLRSHYRLP